LAASDLSGDLSRGDRKTNCRQIAAVNQPAAPDDFPELPTFLRRVPVTRGPAPAHGFLPGDSLDRVDWFRGDRDWEAAKLLAWGDLENEWHYQHGKRWPTWQCAGCNAPIGGSQALNLPDGNRVHFEPIDCLIRFGKRWRGDASEALVALGLEPPRLNGDQQ
jgi:hypothetical protein